MGLEFTCGRQQVDDFLFAIDVRCHASRNGAKDRLVWHFGMRIEPPQVAGKWTQQFQPARPSLWIVPVPFVVPSPLGHEIDGQRASVMHTGHVACKACQG